MRVYKVGWGDEWPQLEVSVPDDSELALFDATYEPFDGSPAHPAFGGVRTARTLHVKLVFIDLDPEVVDPVGVAVPATRPRIVKKEDT